MRNISLVPVVATLIALQGCGEPTSGVRSLTLKTERQQYVAGDTATVLVRNSGPQSVTYNACQHVVERRQGSSAWESVVAFPPPGGACVDVGYTLPAGATISLRIALPATTATGEYRVRFPGLGDRATNAFDVAAGAP